MSDSDLLAELYSIEGFVGAAVFRPNGELLHRTSGGGVNLKAVGVLANNTMVNAQKASIEMGTGKAGLVHVESERGQFVVVCHNEGSHPLADDKDKPHFHLVVVLKPGANLGLAKLTASKTARHIAAQITAPVPG